MPVLKAESGGLADQSRGGLLKNIDTERKPDYAFLYFTYLHKQFSKKRHKVDTHGLTPVALKILFLTGVDHYPFFPEILHIAL